MSNNNTKVVLKLQPHNMQSIGATSTGYFDQDTDLVSMAKQAIMPKGKMLFVVLPILYDPTPITGILSMHRCLHCGECCRTGNPALSETDITAIAQAKNWRTRRIRRMLVDGILHSPCPFLQGNRCSIYASRPLVCRSYPLIPYMEPSFNTNLPVICLALCPSGLELLPKIQEIINVVGKIDANSELSSLRKQLVERNIKHAKENMIIMDRQP